MDAIIQGDEAMPQQKATLWACLAFVCLTAPSTPFAIAEQPNAAPKLLSAFFGLDNALPFVANALCLGASGLDGMPVIFSHTLASDSLQADDFQVITASGATQTPHCVTLRPAQDPGELRTVLLIGEFGNANDDPPTSVQIIDDLHSDGQNGQTVNFKGSSVQVIPLNAGPSLVLAERIPLANLAKETRGTACPESRQQVVRATWAGGVRLPKREEPGDVQRKLYRVTVKQTDGALREVVPFELADLEDGDNNHLLCLDTEDVAVSVSFPAGHFVDPNQDLNPDTQTHIQQGIN